MSSPRLTITVPGRAFRDALGDVPRGVEVLEWDMAAPAPTSSIDIVVPPYMGMVGVLKNLEGVRVRLVQGLSNGYDGVKEALPTNMIFANAVSVFNNDVAFAALRYAELLECWTRHSDHGVQAHGAAMLERFDI